MTNKKISLDKEEQEISDFLQSTDPIDDPNLIAKLEKTAQEHTKRSERISLRVLPSDLEEVKLRAARTGIPYQSIINALIHQYATGQIDLHS